MQKKKVEKKVDSRALAEALVLQMIKFEAGLDKKRELTESERRHVDVLRSFRSLGLY